jgi:hypothetical protein
MPFMSMLVKSPKQKEGSSSFLKKRTKKLLFVSLTAGTGKQVKVFCFFFSKKKYFLPYFYAAVPNRCPA